MVDTFDRQQIAKLQTSRDRLRHNLQETNARLREDSLSSDSRSDLQVVQTVLIHEIQAYDDRILAYSTFIAAVENDATIETFNVENDDAARDRRLAVIAGGAHPSALSPTRNESQPLELDDEQRQQANAIVYGPANVDLQAEEAIVEETSESRDDSDNTWIPPAGRKRDRSPSPDEDTEQPARKVFIISNGIHGQESEGSEPTAGNTEHRSQGGNVAWEQDEREFPAAWGPLFENAATNAGSINQGHEKMATAARRKRSLSVDSASNGPSAKKPRTEIASEAGLWSV